MMRQIGVKPRPAAVAAAIKPCDRVVILGRRLSIDVQVPFAAEFGLRMSTLTRWERPVRSRHSSLAARAAAAMVACAAVPTRNEDGSTGSFPVRSTASSAASGCPAARQISLRTCLGVDAVMDNPSALHDRMLPAQSIFSASAPTIGVQRANSLST